MKISKFIQKLFVFCYILLNVNVNAQQTSNCSKMKEGVFWYFNKNGNKQIIIRKNNTEKIDSKHYQNAPIKFIKWADSCTYVILDEDVDFKKVQSEQTPETLYHKIKAYFEPGIFVVNEYNFDSEKFEDVTYSKIDTQLIVQNTSELKFLAEYKDEGIFSYGISIEWYKKKDQQFEKIIIVSREYEGVGFLKKRILDTMSITLKADESIMTSRCMLNGKKDPNIFAIIKKAYLPNNVKIVKAYRYNDKIEKIELFDERKITINTIRTVISTTH